MRILGRLAIATTALTVFVGVNAVAQQPPPLAFEVASIKTAPPLDPMKLATGQMRVGMHADPSRVEINSLALADIINIAFRVKTHQVVGPAWLSSGMNAERFDIRATLPAGATTEQVPEMLQQLLAERFKLAYHREDRQQDVFALIVAKGGPKMKEAPPLAPAAETPKPGDNPNGVQISGNPQSGVTVRTGAMGATRMSMGSDGLMHLDAERMTMAGLSDALTRLVDRPVVDLTELKGSYAVSLELAMSDVMNMARSAGVAMPAGALGGGGGAAGSPATAASEPGGLSILRSVEALGLKLDGRKMAIAKIVIDRLEKLPTAN